MATLHVSAAGSNTSPYDTWAKAATTLGTAVTAATGDGDVILVDNEHTETLSANTTYTAANNISIIVVDKDNSNALAVMDGTTGYIGGLYVVEFGGAFRVFTRGLYLLDTLTVRVAVTDGADYTFENTYFKFGNASLGDLGLGIVSSGNGYTRFKYCTFNFQNTASNLTHYSSTAEFEGCTFVGTVQSPFMADADRASATPIRFYGCDLSNITGTLVSGTSAQKSQWIFTSCKLGSGVTPLGTPSPANRSGAEVWMYNCAIGDTHYNIAHYSALGETTVSDAVYANDGLPYDGTNKVSWKIVTTAAANFYTPYESPWIDKWNSTLSAVTPYLECLRDNSSGAIFQNDEVWAEFCYPGTSGTVQSSFADDRMTLLGSPANQAASSKSASDWTGETGTPGLFKCGLGSSITPAELGHIRARLVVGEPSITVYVDPQIRT